MAVSIQDKLVERIQQKFPDAEVKKVNIDNYLDIHIPSINPKRGTHLFFNTAKEEIKTGFYCRDEEFILAIVAREVTLEAFSQGLRPLGNTSKKSVDDAVATAEEMLYKIAGKIASAFDKKNEPTIKLGKVVTSNVLDEGLEPNLNSAILDIQSSTKKPETNAKNDSTHPIEKKKVEELVGSQITGDAKVASENSKTKLTSSFDYPFDEQKIKKIKKFNAAERVQFLTSIKENISSVPVPELMVLLGSEEISMQEVKKTFNKYPYLTLLSSFLSKKVDDLNIMLFRGEIQLGQDLFYFLEHFRSSKMTNKSVSKNGEKIEVTFYGQSNSIDKEIVALVCKFENQKLISFDDKTDKVHAETLYQYRNSLEQFNNACYLSATETLKCIEFNELVKEIDGPQLVDFIIQSPKIKCYSSSTEEKFDLLIELGLIQYIKKPKELFDLIFKDYPLHQTFLTKLTSLNQAVINILPAEELVDLFVELLIKKIIATRKEYLGAVDKSTFFVLDGSSVLVEQLPKNDLVGIQKNSLAKYTVEVSKGSESFRYNEKVSVYSLNEATDLLLKGARVFLDQVSNLTSIGISNEKVTGIQKQIDSELALFSEVKESSKSKAESYAAKNKQGKKSKQLLWFGLIILIILVFYQCV